MTSSFTSQADVATDKPVPYMRQLCKHFGHRVDAAFDDDSGYIRFDSGRCDLRAVGTSLHLTVTADDAESRDRLTGVVGSHLERFGRRDGLNVSWT